MNEISVREHWRARNAARVPEGRMLFGVKFETPASRLSGQIDAARAETTDPEKRANFSLDRSNEAILETAATLRNLLCTAFGQNFENLTPEAARAFWRDRIVEEIAAGRIPNLGLLTHIRILNTAFAHLKAQIEASGRFSSEEIAIVERQISLHDVGRLITHHGTLHQAVEAFVGIPNATKSGKKIESDYADFDPKQAAVLAPISALLSLIDTCAKLHPDRNDGSVDDPADFLGVPSEMRDQPIAETWHAVRRAEKFRDHLPAKNRIGEILGQVIIENRYGSYADFPAAEKSELRTLQKNLRRNAKLKTSLFLVLRDLEQIGIISWNDLSEKIVAPISAEVAKTDTLDSFGVPIRWQKINAAQMMIRSKILGKN